MSPCSRCKKSFCSCALSARKLIKKIRGANILDATLGESIFSLHLYSLKRGEHYIEFNLKRLNSSHLITPNEFIVRDRPPLLKSLLGSEILYSKYFPGLVLLHLYSHESKKELFLRIEDSVKALTEQQYERDLKEELLLDS